MDIPKLSNRIKAIAATYRYRPEPFDNSDPTLSALRPFLAQLIYSNMITLDTYWTAQGIRVVSSREFETCLKKAGKNMKVLGEGMYGKVYNVHSDSCIKNIPPDVIHVGIKVENIKRDYDRDQLPERVKEVIEIAKKAASLGIGPALYDAFITKSNDVIKIVKVFEIIDGKPWADTVWSDDKKKHESVELLQEAIHIMNEAGIIHHDLHSGNVMVDTEGKVYIIDYDRARFVSNEESSQLADFNNTIIPPWEPKGAASSAGVKYVYKKLVEEGTIKLTNKKKRKTHKNKK